MKKPKKPTHKQMLSRISKHLGLDKEESVEEAVLELHNYLFND